MGTGARLVFHKIICCALHTNEKEINKNWIGTN
jgi:hypothetical protein